MIVLNRLSLYSWGHSRTMYLVDLWYVATCIVTFGLLQVQTAEPNVHEAQTYRYIHSSASLA